MTYQIDGMVIMPTHEQTQVELVVCDQPRCAKESGILVGLLTQPVRPMGVYGFLFLRLRQIAPAEDPLAACSTARRALGQRTSGG